MKKLLFILLLSPLFSLAQTENRIEKDTLFFKDVKFVKGESLQIGTGSNMATKEFNFISTNASVFAMPIKLASSWNSSKMKIKGFKYVGTKKTGFKYFIILGGGNIVNYICDLEPALNSNEVVTTGVAASTTLPNSKADELKKFKALLDAGAITQAEYDIQKAKILQ